MLKRIFAFGALLAALAAPALATQLYTGTVAAGTKTADIAVTPLRKIAMNASTPVRVMAKNDAASGTSWSALAVTYYEDKAVFESTSTVIQIWGGDVDSRVTLFDSTGMGGSAGSPSADVTSVQGVSGGTPLPVIGPAAAGSAVSTNPLMIGLVARTANSPVVSGAGIYPVATLAGAQIGKPYSIPDADWSYVPPAGGFANSATPVTIIASAGAGIRNYITGMTISSDALGSACDLAVVDSSGSVFLFRHHLTTAGAPAGINITFPTPLRGPAATALTIKTLVGGSGTAVTGAIYVNVQGYQAP